MSSLYPYALQWPKHDFRVLFYFYRITSVLEMDMVCKFNSNVTSYNDRNASFKIALSVSMALVFVTRAIMY